MVLTSIERQVRERTTAVYQCTLVDENDVAISSADLDALTLTLYNKVDRAIINSRDHQNVLNTNNVTVSNAGVLVWIMQPADNQIINSDLPAGALECHIALFEWTWDVTKYGKYEVQIDVIQMIEVPNA